MDTSFGFCDCIKVGVGTLLTWVTPCGIFVLKSVFPQQVFTGSYYGQGPGLADLGVNKRKALSPAQHCSLEQIHGYE